jgi:beta-lactam-binding protein with PASTA domain
MERALHRTASALLWLMLLPLRISQFLLRHKEWVMTSMGMLAAMLLAAGITLRIALHVREVTVPDMIGRTLQEASSSALQSGVDLVIENKFYSTTVPAGRVVSQYPRPDTVVRHGWQVRVAESLGPQQVTIPDVVGETVRNASVDIRKDKLDLGTLAHIEAPGMDDMVLAQTPPPNGGVDQPQVNLLLSSTVTASANAIVLPSFVGMTSAGAIRSASELGLVVAGVGDGPVVTSQTPGAGFRAVRGDSVRVVLGGGEAPGAGTTPSGATVAPVNKPAVAPISLPTP